MITSVDAFLRFFDGVHKRALRDIAALPPEADGWAPATGTGEKAWTINRLVGHIAGARVQFASGYAGKGWFVEQPPDVSSRALWVPALEQSAEELRAQLAGTPDEWLERKIEMAGSSVAFAGWRLLMMMLEHDVHHRSQIDSYAGINGWDVPQIFGRRAEDTSGMQAREGTLRA